MRHVVLASRASRLEGTRHDTIKRIRSHQSDQRAGCGLDRGVVCPVTLAYAMGSAIQEGGFSADKQSDVQAAPSTDQATWAADVAQSTTSLSETMMEPSASTFGGLSLTSAASTGHASPNGCCTWN
jgi:hypothetical protein